MRPGEFEIDHYWEYFATEAIRSSSFYHFLKRKLLIDVSECPLYATKAARFTQINVEKTVCYYISYSKIQQYCGTLSNCIEWGRRSVPSAAIPYTAPYVLRVGHARKTSKGLGTRLVSGLLSLERMRSSQTRRVQRDINKERSRSVRSPNCALLGKFCRYSYWCCAIWQSRQVVMDWSHSGSQGNLVAGTNYAATSPRDKGDSGEFGATLLIQTILYQAEVKGLQLVDTNS